MRSLGAEVEETSLPSTRHALAVYYIIAPSEASANLARYDGVKYGFSVHKMLIACGMRWRRRGNLALGQR